MTQVSKERAFALTVSVAAWASTASPARLATAADAQLDDNVVRHVTMTIARDTTGAHGTLTVQEASNTPVSIGPSTLNAAPPDTSYWTLDQFVIGFNGTPGAPGIAVPQPRRSCSTT
jgi:hypothetical protein